MPSKHLRELESEVRQSRDALTKRWNILQLEIGGLGKTATDQVHQSIQEAKEAVSIRHHVSKRPWTMVLSSINEKGESISLH